MKISALLSNGASVTIDETAIVAILFKDDEERKLIGNVISNMPDIPNKMRVLCEFPDGQNELANKYVDSIEAIGYDELIYNAQ